MPKTKSQSPKLSDTQLVILNAAVKRPDHSLLPFPQNLTVKGAPLDKVIATLRKRNLVEERRIVEGVPEWRRGDDSRAYGLFVTIGGLLALGIEDTDTDRPQQAAAAMPRNSETGAEKSCRKSRNASHGRSKRSATQSKQDLVIPAWNVRR